SVRERAALLGGYVKVESQPGNGTRVEIVVPLDKQRRDDQSEEAISVAAETPASLNETRSDRFATPAASDRVRVLLADDHRMLREGLAGLLDGLDDLEVVGQANDGHEAVEMAESLRPDVVVMDVSMPRMNG